MNNQQFKLKVITKETFGEYNAQLYYLNHTNFNDSYYFSVNEDDIQHFDTIDDILKFISSHADVLIPTEYFTNDTYKHTAEYYAINDLINIRLIVNIP
jgi:hypothetical protein